MRQKKASDEEKGKKKDAWKSDEFVFLKMQAAKKIAVFQFPLWFGFVGVKSRITWSCFIVVFGSKHIFFHCITSNIEAQLM